ncbi:LacI family transcriptional regulator [Streptomyces sp. Amel2xB2]|uniref:LacI family DNA-binding transcriptional regulator n=1 Tax=Streptomyces sp. Amel2xB2 TaxID=1305829 RepID=UPI000DB9610E|nr:LacI family DNA-binding transcriptional regulator [Streptomyces sp. Amel2xB2]RAJ69804.1 LacI family transcriptional regulator [Streptomyces sp. Amel2xB2]
MAVTLADVATRAGVSAATVSRVLSGNYPVAGATRTRVMRAVEELQYVVNGPASALAAATSDLVGVLVNDIADPFFGIIASAVQSEMGTGGEGGPGARKLAVVCNTGGSTERELTYLTHLQRQRAAAVVLTGSGVEDEEHGAALATRLRRLAASGTRIVLCGRPPLAPEADKQEREQQEQHEQNERRARQEHRQERERIAEDGRPSPGTGTAPATGTGTGTASAAGEGDGIVTVAFDNRGGSRRLTEHLLSLGHRSIGYVTGPANRTTTRDRLEGHRQALRAVAPELLAQAEQFTVHGGAYDRSSGYDGALELLRRVPDLTAVLAANDTVALGICAALRDQGLRIPEDVSVAGFDDLPFSADASPTLTTVRIPLHDAGARAGRLALGREAPPPGGVATVRTELMARGSTAPPAGRRG